MTATASRTETSDRSPNSRPHLVPSAGPVIHVRKPGATATENDRDAIMAYLAHIDTDWWNPWRRDDEAQAIRAAHAILEQWTETGGANKEEIDAWMAASHEYALQERRRRDADRARRKANYNPAQEADRLALLEAESLLYRAQEMRTSMISGPSDPAMAAERRASQIARLEEEHAEWTRRVDELRAKVPDPELVADKRGWLPADRRVWSKSAFAARRRRAVTDLRQERLDARAELGTTPKAQRRELLARVRDVQARLDLWLGIAEPEVEQMCSECSTLLAWHVWSTGGLEALIGFGPCPAYPRQRERNQRVSASFEAAARKARNDPLQPGRRHDPRTKAQLLDEIDRLQAQIARQAQPCIMLRHPWQP